MLTTAVAMAVATVLLLAAANGADVRRNHAPDGCFDRCARGACVSLLLLHVLR